MKYILIPCLLLFIWSCEEETEPAYDPVEQVELQEDSIIALEEEQEQVIYLNGPRLEEIDEAAQDPSLVQFRKQLIEAIQEKDKEYLLKIIHPEGMWSYGGTEGGVKGFEKMWFTQSGDSSAVWMILDVILKNGGNFYEYPGQKRTEFAAPFAFSNWSDTLDAFQYDVILDKEVPVYAMPSKESKVVIYADHHIVIRNWEQSLSTINNPFRKYNKGDQFKDWQHISTYDGRELGFVYWDQVWSPIGYRAIFSKENGKWWLRVLIAGD